MFFPFSKQSKVRTHKSCFSNNDNFTHNDFKISLLSFHPIMKIGSSNRNNSTIGHTPSPSHSTLENQVKAEAAPTEVTFSQKNNYRTLILCAVSGFAGGALTVCLLNFMKKRKKTKDFPNNCR